MLRKFFLLSVVIAIATVLGSITNTETAKAISIYDDNYQTTNNLVTWANGSYPCSEVDSTLTWSEYITSPSTWPDPSAASNPNSSYSVTKASFMDAMDHGTWGGVSGLSKLLRI